ncbi:MAG: cytochrome P450 [Actinomycetota bacterium]
MALVGVRPLQRRRSIGRDFRAVWAAVLVSSTGDGMFITAFPLLAATITTDPLLIAGVTIAEGDLVLLDPGSANHDPAFFAHPDVADFTRRGTPPMSFGYGRRYCLGAPLARLELKSGLSQLIPRFPDMRLTVDAADLGVDVDSLGSGLRPMPVTW